MDDGVWALDGLLAEIFDPAHDPPAARLVYAWGPPESSTIANADWPGRYPRLCGVARKKTITPRG